MIHTPPISDYETDEGIVLSLCDECSADLGHPYVWQRFAPPTAMCCVCNAPNGEVTHIDAFWQDKPRKHILKVEPVMLDVLPPDMDSLSVAIRRFQRSMGA